MRAYSESWLPRRTPRSSARLPKRHRPSQRLRGHANERSWARVSTPPSSPRRRSSPCAPSRQSAFAPSPPRRWRHLGPSRTRRSSGSKGPSRWLHRSRGRRSDRLERTRRSSRRRSRRCRARRGREGSHSSSGNESRASLSPALLHRTLCGALARGRNFVSAAPAGHPLAQSARGNRRGQGAFCRRAHGWGTERADRGAPGGARGTIPERGCRRTRPEERERARQDCVRWPRP